MAEGGAPVVQGIKLVSTDRLPDSMRGCFPFPYFNAVQSRSFPSIYDSNDNFVLSAPTGSGKTVVLELALLRLLSSDSGRDYKVVYQAPTKSLCAERMRDWQTRFRHLSLNCLELTGDTDYNNLQAIRKAQIIITTPEKWDSVTRKGKDNRKLLQMIKLVLIDEIHILKEDRGACLEVIVSRMKSIGTDVRFVALSATVPNCEDIAAWLGKDACRIKVPAAMEVFGEEFRPVKLQKYVVGFHGGNDFMLEKTCNAKLPEIISRFSQGKPIMVFCNTRKSCVTTAQLLAEWWSKSRPQDRYWDGLSGQIALADQALRSYVASGVAFHHAGIDLSDRARIEKAYLDGHIKVICCTSTLAVGVNLPCHLVIIKNTVTWQDSCAKEYSDIEIMQMLGRAGRPQFDRSAVAVIMTRSEKVNRYERMVSGEEILESRLHLNLIDHLNAEIGLGTVQNMQTAMIWLESTFFFVRFRLNPVHYKLQGNNWSGDLDDCVRHICGRDLKLLQEYSLVTDDDDFTSTELGDAMARYYIQFDTMKVFLGLQKQAKISEILSAIAQAAEFSVIRFRSGEKPMYKEINRSPLIKFSIRVDLALPAQKISLIIQSLLGGIAPTLGSGDHIKGQRQQYESDLHTVLQHVHRLARCIIDCQVHFGDSIATRNALELARSLGARAWDDSPLQLTQLENIGPVAVRKLLNANVKTFEDLEGLDAQKIEMILSKNPPFGANLLTQVRGFPKLRVQITLMRTPPAKADVRREKVEVNVKATFGFINENVPHTFQKRAVYVYLLAETSDGRILHFCKISAGKLGSGQDALFTAELTNAQQLIHCYVACDDIAGSLKFATLNPGIPAYMFPKENPLSDPTKAMHRKGESTDGKTTMAITNIKLGRKYSAKDEFDDDGLDDLAFTEAFREADFEDIDSIPLLGTNRARSHVAGSEKSKTSAIAAQNSQAQPGQPVRLENGNYACAHRCKNKKDCKHTCCKEGCEKLPRPPKDKNSDALLSGNQSISSMKGFEKRNKFHVSGRGESHKESSRGSLKHKIDQESRSSSTEYGDGLDITDYDELGQTSAPVLTSVPSKTSKRLESFRQSMFITDSSSPYKQQRVPTLDLTGGQSGVGPGLQAKRSCDIVDDVNHSHNYKSAPYNKRQRVFFGGGLEEGVGTLTGSDGLVHPFTYETQEPSEFDDLDFGEDDLTKMIDHGHGESAFDDHDVEEAMLEQKSLEKDSSSHDLKSDGYTFETESESVSKPQASLSTSQRIFGVEETDLGLDGPFANSLESEEVHKHASSKPLEQKESVDEADDSGTDAWLMKEFGDYVNFV